MNSWNFRVTRRELVGEVEYAIREIYYDENRKIIGWTENASAPTGETNQELIEELIRMLAATQDKVIDITDEDNPEVLE